MSITVDSSAFSPVAQAQLVQLGAEQSTITALTGVTPDSGTPFGPAATLTLSPAAQSLLDGRVPGLQLQSLEHSDGIDAASVAKLASETAQPEAADFDPANPFGDASAAQLVDEFDPANPFGAASAAQPVDEFDPADPFGAAPA